MVKVNVDGYNMYLDGTLRENLDQIKNAVLTKDMDYLGVVGGNVGTGKSIFVGGTLAPYFDSTFRGESAIQRMCQTGEEFKEEVMKAKKFQCVVFDEAITATAARRSMQKINFVVFSMLEQIRQKNLFIFIILPNWFALDSNISLDRATSLYYVYVPKNKPFQRGRFVFFNRSRKHMLWMKGKRLHTHNPRLTVAGNFNGRFTHQVPFDEDRYKIKKLESFEKYVKDMEVKVKVPVINSRYKKGRDKKLDWKENF